MVGKKSQIGVVNVPETNGMNKQSKHLNWSTSRGRTCMHVDEERIVSKYFRGVSSSLLLSR